jgi:hypothetical protein
MSFFAKPELGYILGAFFMHSSGHPAYKRATSTCHKKEQLGCLQKGQLGLGMHYVERWLINAALRLGREYLLKSRHT